MPDDIPLAFKLGDLLSSASLNELQGLIMQALAEHDHTGGAKAAQITTDGLADQSVTAPKLADAAVELRALATGAVDMRVLADGAVTADKIAVDAVGTDALVDGGVTQDKLSDEVQALLLRTGGGASSASQVIWRDPVYTYPKRVDDNVSIIDGIVDPVNWDWDIKTVSVNDDDQPIKFRPHRDKTKVVSVIEKTATPAKDYDLITKQLNEASHDAAAGIVAVGAAGFGHKGISLGKTPTGPFGPVAGGPFGTTAMMAMRTEPMEAEMAMMMSTDPSADVMRTATITSPPPGSAAPNKAAEYAIKRAMTLGTVDGDGRPVERGASNAIVVHSGFSGQSSFVDGGETIDFRNLEGASATRQNLAAQAVGRIMFNLGIDSDYLDDVGASDSIKLFWREAHNGQRDFFASNNPFWQPHSWLPDILARPELLGTGYSLSGGRNIQSVTREYRPTHPSQPADTWVRVRFITPYRNAAYAINVTPRAMSQYVAVTANIRAKTVDYVDINFVGLQRADGSGVTFSDISKLSFDLAIYGELGEPS